MAILTGTRWRRRIMSVKLICPICRNEIAVVVPDSLSRPITGKMFSAKASGYPDPWPLGNSWETMYCPYSANGVRHWPFLVDHNDSGQVAFGPVRILTDEGEIFIKLDEDSASVKISGPADNDVDYVEEFVGGEKAEFVCEFCGSKFRAEHRMRRHILDKHKGMVWKGR